ncbi:DMT family transporter [Sulfurimonas sp. SAG-AH-194-L11]|nr:DMT family transporter [Sulfurimonas sp. SAG-AH-194-L11]MDF1877642.1 DMT family transporter [Sulfurimonas sp. SAG-AH-194-L11]
MEKEREGELLMLGLSVIESWFPILSIMSMAYIGALHTYMYSLIIALFFFIILMFKRKRFSELKNRAAYKDLLLTSFFITTLFTLVFIGLQYTTAGNMAVIVFLQLLFAFLYFNVLGKEKMDRVHLIGSVIMGIGAILVLIPEELTLNKGDLFILAAAAIAPFANLYQKRARQFCSSETILTFRTVVGLPFIAALAYYLEPEVSYPAFMQALPYLLIIGIAVYVVSKIMWIEALHRISITKVSAMMGLVPLMTVLFAFLFLGESPSLKQALGLIPILIGGYILTRPIKQL